MPEKIERMTLAEARRRFFAVGWRLCWKRRVPHTNTKKRAWWQICAATDGATTPDYAMMTVFAEGRTRAAAVRRLVVAVEAVAASAKGAE